MLPVLIGVAAMTVIGLLVALAIDRSMRGPQLLGLAFLYGSGTVYLAMFVLSLLHIKWSLVRVVTTLTLIACAAFVIWRRSMQLPAAGTQHNAVKPHLFDLVTLITLVGYTSFATVAPLWEWDFWAIWGLKARVFLDSGGIDWTFLERHWNVFVHPDYPLLVPLNYDFVTLLGGGWSDRWLGIVVVAWAVALILIVRGITRDEASNFISAGAAFAISSVAISRFVGLAEAAVIAFAGAAMLYLRRALLTDDPMAWRHGALLLGFAASCKNEGLALSVAIVFVMIAIEPRAWRRVIKLWPVLVIVAPWLILRAVHVLPTDVVSGSVLGRFVSRLGDTRAILRDLLAYTYDLWSWVAMLVALAVVPHTFRSREKFVLLVTTIQLAVYIAIYFSTPATPHWHIMTSWSRLTVQVQVPITVVIVLMLTEWLRVNSAHAEARSEQP